MSHKTNIRIIITTTMYSVIISAPDQSSRNMGGYWIRTLGIVEPIPRWIQIQRCLFNVWVQNLDHYSNSYITRQLSSPKYPQSQQPISPETLKYQGFRNYTKNHLPIKLPLSIDGNCYGTPDWVRTSDLQSRSLSLYPAELRARTGAEFIVAYAKIIVKQGSRTTLQHNEKFSGDCRN